MKHLDESMLRDKSKQQMMNLKKTIDNAGGDIADKVYKSEQSKEGDMPNSYHLDNPFASSRRIETYGDFVKNDTHKKRKKKHKITESLDNDNLKEGDEVMIDQRILDDEKIIKSNKVEEIEKFLDLILTVDSFISENDHVVLIDEDGEKIDVDKKYVVKFDFINADSLGESKNTNETINMENKLINESENNNWKIELSDYIKTNLKKVLIKTEYVLNTIIDKLINKFNIDDTDENVEFIKNELENYTNYQLAIDVPLDEKRNISDYWQVDLSDYIKSDMRDVVITKADELERIINDLMNRFNIKDNEENREYVKDEIYSYTNCEVPEEETEIDEVENSPLKESKKTTSKKDKKEDKQILSSFADFYKKEKVKEYDEAKQRPMYNNIPDEKTITSYNPNRDSKFINFDGKVGQIVKVEGDSVYLDIINDEDKHETIKMNTVELMKKIIKEKRKKED
jgi:hypothetical protein